MSGSSDSSIVESDDDEVQTCNHEQEPLGSDHEESSVVSGKSLLAKKLQDLVEQGKTPTRNNRRTQSTGLIKTIVFKNNPKSNSYPSSSSTSKCTTPSQESTEDLDQDLTPPPKVPLDLTGVQEKAKNTPIKKSPRPVEKHIDNQTATTILLQIIAMKKSMEGFVIGLDKVGTCLGEMDKRLGRLENKMFELTKATSKLQKVSITLMVAQKADVDSILNTITQETNRSQ